MLSDIMDRINLPAVYVPHPSESDQALQSGTCAVQEGLLQSLQGACYRPA